MIITENDEARIVRSTYWTSEMAERGLAYVSPNAGVIRLMLPPDLKQAVRDMRLAEEVVITRGVHDGSPPWTHLEGREMTEIMFDDHSASPYLLNVDIAQWERLPDSETDYNRAWELTVWEDRRGTPHRVLTKLCFLRRARLPCMKGWG